MQLLNYFILLKESSINPPWYGSNQATIIKKKNYQKPALQYYYQIVVCIVLETAILPCSFAKRKLQKVGKILLREMMITELRVLRRFEVGSTYKKLCPLPSEIKILLRNFIRCFLRAIHRHRMRHDLIRITKLLLGERANNNLSITALSRRFHAVHLLVTN